MSANKIEVLNIWADEAGISHFREIEFDLEDIPQGGSISRPIAVTNLWFRATPEGQDMDFHPAPRRQLVVTLSGGVAQITASDGETRLVKPGDLVLVEDTFGQGHRSKAFDGLPRTSVFIGLADQV
jgi:hypothetical protein